MQALPGERRRIASAVRERFAAVRWQARQRSAEWGQRLQAFRADHRKVSIAVIVGVLLALALAGAAAAMLGAGRNADVVAVDYVSRYVTVTGPNGSQAQTDETTLNEDGQVTRTVVRTRVVTGSGRLTTLREIIPVAGPAGGTKTVAGPTKTVTVAGPGQTVTQTETQVVTEVVTVTVTVKKDKNG